MKLKLYEVTWKFDIHSTLTNGSTYILTTPVMEKISCDEQNYNDVEPHSKALCNLVVVSAYANYTNFVPHLSILSHDCCIQKQPVGTSVHGNETYQIK